MQKLQSLTREQQERLSEYRDKWLQIGLSTAPADRKRSEASVRAAYDVAGLAEPKTIIWLRSPLEGAIGAAMLGVPQFQDLLGKSVRDQVWGQVWDQVRGQVRGQVRDQVGDQVWGQVGDQVRDQVWDQVWGQVGDQVRDQVGDQVWDQVGGQVGDQVYRCGYGLHDANWLAFYEYFREVCAIEAANKLSPLMDLAQSCGWWWPFEGAVILTERPSRLKRDEQNRLHSDDGMAIEYPDGWGIYAWHGVRIQDSRIILNPKSLTIKEIEAEQNVEIRRVMIERYGLADYVQKSGAIEIHSDNFGTLYRKEVADDEPIMMVKVINSTPEPDGSFKPYFLRVHPELRPLLGTNADGSPKLGKPQILTAKNAVASSFGCRGIAYCPVVES